MRRKNYMYGSCFVLTGWKPHMQYSVHFHQKILSGVTEWLESSNMEVSKVMRVPSKNSSIEPLDLFFFSEVTLFNELRWPQSCPDVMNVDDHPLEGTGRSLQKPRPNIPHVVRFSRKFAITRIHHSQGRSIQVLCSFRLFTSVSRPWYFSKLSCFWFRMGYPNL